MFRGRFLAAGAAASTLIAVVAVAVPDAWGQGGSDPTTTTVTASVNPAVVGQPVTYTARVSDPSDSGTPTGTVGFSDDGNPIAGCSSKSLDGGSPDIATCTTTYDAVTAGDSIVATYSGNDTYAGSNSSASPLTEVVQQDGTATTVTSSASPSAVGQSVVFSATVTALGPGSGTPTGTVAFFDDGNPITGCSSQSLDLGSPDVAACTTSYDATTTGDSITASYGGDANFTGSDNESSPFTQVVVAYATSTTVSSSSDPSVTGQSLTYSALVMPTPSDAGTPTGTVAFSDSAGPIAGCAAQPVDQGSPDIAMCTTVETGFPTDHITATYSGDSNFATSTSSPLTQTVNSAGTSTSLSSSDPNPVSGETVTFTAQVTPTAPSVVVAGTVTFTVTDAHGTPLTCSGGDTVSFSGGSAPCSVVLFATGSAYDVGASFAGTGYQKSTASSLDQPVATDSTSVDVESSIDPTVTGQPVTFTASVSADAPGSGTPTGTVTFTVQEPNGKDTSCSGGDTQKLPEGSSDVACNVPSGGIAQIGPSTVTATYNGSDNYAEGASSPATQTVDPAATTTTLSSSSNPAKAGKPVTFSATVRVDPPGGGNPGGGGGSIATFTITGAKGMSVVCKGGSGQSVGKKDVATCTVGKRKLVAANSPYQVQVTFVTNRGGGAYLSSSASLTETVP